MTLDIRAKVFCDRGRVVSGGFSDDHVQGTGLIRTRGEIVLEGLVTLRPGDRIRLGYEKRGRVARIPRALRVLSSFADPFRRVTTVSVGCKLTMLEGFRENKQKLAAEDSENAGIPCDEYKNIPINTSFNFIATECLSALGITPQSPLSLSGSVAGESVSFETGYVQLLSDLLFSQSKVGFLNADEALVVVDLAAIGGSSPVFDEDDLIDVSPVRSGDLPPDVVLVEYSYNRLKLPDKDTVGLVAEQQERDWEKDVTQGEPEQTQIYLNGGTQLYTVNHYPVSTSQTTYDKLDRVIRREERTTTYGAKLNSAYVTELLEQTGSAGPNTGKAEQLTVTEFIYKYDADQLVTQPAGLAPCASWYYIGTGELYNPDRDSQPIAQVVTKYGTDLEIAGKVGFQTYFYGDGTLHPGNTVAPIEVTRVEFETDTVAGITKTKTYRQAAYVMTQAGQQGLAKMAESVSTVAAAADILRAAGKLVNTGVEVQLEYDRFFGLQKRPSLEERKQDEFGKDPRESVSRTEFIQGTEGVGTPVTYSLPWAPDDRIGYRSGNPEPYVLQASQAPELARKFARVQQKLAYGHRMGFAIQTAPDKLPPYAASTATLRIGGILADYLVNAQSWSFDQNGIVASVDMVYLGGVGASTTAHRVPAPWSPVQDGITQLPLAPAVTTNPAPAPANSVPTPSGFDPSAPGNIFDTLPTATNPVYEKEITVDSLVPPYQEVVVNQFSTYVRADVTRSLIALPPETVDVSLGVRVGNATTVLTNNKTDVALTVRVGSAVSHPQLPLRDLAPTVRVGSAVDKQLPVNFTLETTTAAPLAGASQTTATPAGWTQVFSGSENNDAAGAARWEMTGLPFDFVIDSATFRSFWLYPSLTLGFGSNIAFTTPSATVPAQPKLHVYARRVQYVKKVYQMVTANTYRVRVEATETSTSFPRVVEIAFFNPAKFANRTIVEVRVGVNGSTGDFFNAYSASSSLGAGLGSKPANASYVLESLDANGTSWSLTKDRHVTPVE